MHNRRSLGGNVGQKLGQQQCHNNESDRLVSLAGGGFDRRLFDRPSPLLHTSYRFGRVLQQEEHLQRVERVFAEILNSILFPSLFLLYIYIKYIVYIYTYRIYIYSFI